MTRRQRTSTRPVALPPLESAPGNWLRGIRFSGFTLSVLFLIVSALVVLAPSLRILIEQQQEITALRTAVDERGRRVDELDEQISRWSDPAYIESQARSRLYYVYPGEISYLVIDDGAAPAEEDGLPISDEIQNARVDWMHSLLSSVVTAALTEASPTDLTDPEATP